MRTDQITWVIKTSKFCNMRCSYCYEWDELADRTKMSAELLCKLFVAVKTLHEGRQSALGKGTQVVSKLVLHGGEPLILPLPYLKNIFTRANEIFGASLLNTREVHFSVQSNLLSVSDEVADLLYTNAVDLGVSFDVVPGVRRLVSGGETEMRVLRNMDRLRARGHNMGGLSVLAKHTAPKITDIYDFFAARQMSMRVLPLFEGPAGRPRDHFAITNDDLVPPLISLFVHWLETGARINVAPLSEWLQNVLRKMLGVRGDLYKRRTRGDGVILVNTDGKLYCVLDAYQAPFGDLNTQTLSEILHSPDYEASLVREEVLTEKHCRDCDYAGACNGWALFSSKYEGPYTGRCPLTFSCHQAIEAYVRECELDTPQLWAMLASALKEREAGHSIVESGTKQRAVAAIPAD